MSSRRMANERNTPSVMVAVSHVTDYGIMNLWTVSVSFLHRGSPFSSVFVHSFFISLLSKARARARAPLTEIGARNEKA